MLTLLRVLFIKRNFDGDEDVALTLPVPIPDEGKLIFLFSHFFVVIVSSILLLKIFTVKIVPFD